MIEIFAHELPSGFNWYACSPVCQRRAVMSVLKGRYMRSGNLQWKQMFDAVAAGLPIDGNVIIIESVLTLLA